ncbi:hypothetical protein OV079_01850 [Nannocystis pusilla]|uniref:Uncharacterized protein n=1 Tax=Nannocystis pusilla TaxID=889268 RepID=A0A9X3EHS7_9BACT|nr:hypothetical protein [Nannocystis pusilla]MCY1004328.1 hypothetical protein [Nannocystis pusilla]
MAFRARWEEELVRTTLENCPAGRSWPRPRDTWDLVLAAIRAHAKAPADQPFRLVLVQGIALGATFLAGVRVGTVLLRLGLFLYWLPGNITAGVPFAELALTVAPLVLELVTYMLLGVAVLLRRRAGVGVGAVALVGIGLLATLRYSGPFDLRWALGMAVPGAVPFLVAAAATAATTAERALAVRPAFVGLALVSMAAAAWRLAALFVTATWHLSPGTVDRVSVAAAALLLAVCIAAGFADPRWLVALGLAVVSWNAREFIQTADPLAFLGTAVVVTVAWVHWRVLRRGRAA